MQHVSTFLRKNFEASIWLMIAVHPKDQDHLVDIDHSIVAHARCTASGSKGDFKVGIVLDSRCNMDMRISRQKAVQIGLLDATSCMTSTIFHAKQRAIQKWSTNSADWIYPPANPDICITLCPSTCRC